MPTRLYVCGRTCIDAPAGFFGEGAFPARQGRLAWTYLLLERHRTVPRDQLIDVVWGADAPPASDRALSAILSKIRALAARADIGASALQGVGSGLRLLLPANIWIDWEIAYADIERAVRLCAHEKMREAYGWALASYMIAREDLLPGEEAPWLVGKRFALNALLIRAIDVLVQIYRATDNFDMAAQFAEEFIARDPLREASYRRLFELYVQLGDSAALIQTYERCRRTFDDQLGHAPSAQTDALYRRALDALACGGCG